MKSVDPLAEAAREMLGVLQSIDFSGTHMSYDDVPFAKWEAAVAAAELQSTIPPHGGHAMTQAIRTHRRLVARQRAALNHAASADRAAVLEIYGPLISRANSAIADSAALPPDQWHGNCCCTRADDMAGCGCGHWSQSQ